VATRFEELKDHKKRGAKLKHCITLWSKQFSGKFFLKKIEISIKFYVIEFCEVLTKEFKIPKVIVS